VVNRGVGGETTEAGRARVAGVLAGDKPDWLTMAYGLNDARHKDAAKFRKDLAALLDAASGRKPAPRLMLVTATPFVDEKHQWGKDPFFVKAGGLDRFLDRELNGQTRNLAAEKGLPLCDLHRHFLLGAGPAKLLRDDGVHLLPAGNEHAAAQLARCLYAAHAARVLADPAAAGAEVKARTLAEKARKALDAAPGAAPREAADALKEAGELCPYLPEAAVLRDRLDAAAGR